MSPIRKLLVILPMCLVLSMPARAWNNLRYSLDWGYMASMYQIYSYNYMAEEGFRVEQHGHDLFLNSNGVVKVFLGTQIGGHAELGVFSGYEGIRQDRRIVPLGLRTSWMFNGTDADGPICYAEGGAAFHKDCKTTAMGAVGAGWHVQLDHGCGMDFKFGLNVFQDHPAIMGVPKENLNKSDYTYGGISFTVGISF